MGLEKEYIKWYKIAEEILSGSIPVLSEDEIVKFISQNNWLMVPAGNEKDRQDSIVRSDPNIYFGLERDKIEVGFFCNTLESVRRIRNLLHGFHTTEKEDFIRALRKLDDQFETRVERKLKEQHFQQTPVFEVDFRFRTNAIDGVLLAELFRRVDGILQESDARKMTEGKSWRTLAPVINIAHTFIDRDENKFKEVLSQLKPAYEIALRVKTDAEIQEEITRREKTKLDERKQRFREFVDDLKRKGVSGEEYREAVMRWNRENPQ